MINRMEIPTTKQKLTERIRGDDVYSASHLKRDNLGRYLTIEYARDLNKAVSFWKKFNGAVAYLPLMGDKGLIGNICRMYNDSGDECVEFVTHTYKQKKETGSSDAPTSHLSLPMQSILHVVENV